MGHDIKDLLDDFIILHTQLISWHSEHDPYKIKGLSNRQLITLLNTCNKISQSARIEAVTDDQSPEKLGLVGDDENAMRILSGEGSFEPSMIDECESELTKSLYEFDNLLSRLEYLIFLIGTEINRRKNEAPLIEGFIIKHLRGRIRNIGSEIERRCEVDNNAEIGDDIIRHYHEALRSLAEHCQERVKNAQATKAEKISQIGNDVRQSLYTPITNEELAALIKVLEHFQNHERHNAVLKEFGSKVEQLLLPSLEMRHKEFDS